LDCWIIGPSSTHPSIHQSISSSLPLLVAFIAADDADDAFALHDLAVFTKLFD
jgi:hypothetical protein